MNEELIKTLMDERDELYPNGCPMQPRGWGKTNLYFMHLLKFSVYEMYCNIYKNSKNVVSLEKAHEDINKFIAEFIDN